jgi:tetratricopeptide (TPR) repeat protein
MFWLRITTVLLLLPSCSLCAAQTGSSFQHTRPTPSVEREVRVQVSYDNHDVAPRVLVIVENIQRGEVGRKVTDSHGEASFFSLPPGEYRLKLSGSGIGPITRVFNYSPFEPTHIEVVQVRREASAPDTQGAQGTVATAALLVPEKARNEFEKGRTALTNKRFDEARKHFDKAIEVYPGYASAYHSLGVVESMTNNRDKARADFEKAISIDSKFVAAYLDLSRILYAEQRYAEAQTVLGKALASDPDNLEILTSLARADLLTGNLDAAIEHAQKVHSAPDHQSYAVVHLIAGKALEQKGLRDQAALEYQILLKESPEGPVADRARNSLQALQQ